MQKAPSSPNISLLVIVTLVAIAVHVAALFFLQNTSISSFSMGRASNFALKPLKNEEALLREFHTSDNDPVASLFQQLAQTPSSFAPAPEQALNNKTAPPSLVLHTPPLPTLAPAERYGDIDTKEFAEETFAATNKTTTLPIHTLTPPKQLPFLSGSFLKPSSTTPEESSNIPGLSAEDFLYELKYTASPQGEGYIFRLSIEPKPYVNLTRLHQTIYLIMDRSNSISKEKFHHIKEGVLAALDAIHPDDRFNIIAFDNNLSRLSDKPLFPTDENRKRAQAFVLSQKRGGLFSSTDIYSSLNKILPTATNTQGITTALLISDGDTFISKEKERKMLAKWSKDNNGRISLFCIATGQGNNLPLLELLSSFNKGLLLYSNKDEDLPQTLQSLIHSIKHPLGSNMLATAASHGNSNITLYPPSSRLPNLYQNIPYLIYGSTDSINDVTIFLQGNSSEEPFTIKHTLSFNNEGVADPSIENQYHLYKAHTIYEKYLSDGDSSHLAEIKQLIGPPATPTKNRTNIYR
ncbi:VWA domain-containing protein [Simkania negevensis]|uniref:VWA domain-containing protein n=1 Tax=Simkania negevensis TaxID=83561 RepID=A0ABS3AU09_9BACT|nr:VWA domain-containing protein [Simkania negevensis]